MSTLHVENLKGLSSGGNANKIIVPSGQTLDASNGFVAPAGHVIQTVVGSTNSLTTGTATFATIGSGSITPISTSSKILLTLQMHVYVGLYTTDTWVGCLMRVTRNGTVINGDTGADPYGNGALKQNDLDRYMEYSTRMYIDSPSSTSSVSYVIQGAAKASRSTMYINSADYGDGGNFYLQEIAG
mgnify:FL=1